MSNTDHMAENVDASGKRVSDGHCHLNFSNVQTFPGVIAGALHGSEHIVGCSADSA